MPLSPAGNRANLRLRWSCDRRRRVKWLTIDILRRVARDVGVKRLRSETLPEAKAEFLESIHEAKEGEAATKHLRACLSEAIEARSGGKDKLALQREFIQLGQFERRGVCVADLQTNFWRVAEDCWGNRDSLYR